MGTKRGAKVKIKTELLSASKVLQTLLANGKSPLSDQFLRWKIWRFWPQIVGETLGAVCEPVGFERGRLLCLGQECHTHARDPFFRGHPQRKSQSACGAKLGALDSFYLGPTRDSHGG